MAAAGPHNRHSLMQGTAAVEFSGVVFRIQIRIVAMIVE
jgi:hypothetical protein